MLYLKRKRNGRIYMKNFLINALISLGCLNMMLFCYSCKQKDVESPVNLMLCGTGEKIEVDKGSLSLDEIIVARDIRKENVIYEGGEKGFLLFKMYFDFKTYSLRECGVSMRGPYPDYQSGAVRLNYRNKADGQGLFCPVEEDGDFDIRTSTALSSAKLHINAAEGKTKGEAYLCFKLSEEIYEHLCVMKNYNEESEKIFSLSNTTNLKQFEIVLEINDIIKKGFTSVEIGGTFKEIPFLESYVIP